MTHDALVIGAGIQGLCTAFHLRRSGLRGIAVVDQHHEAHAHGSSHGHTRITRSSYADRRWIELAEQAHRHGWRELTTELGAQLLLPTPGLFFGPETGPFGAFLAATLGSGARVERIAVARARELCPLLRIDDTDAVLLDHTAAVVAAERTMTGLRTWCDAHGVERVVDTKCTDLRREGGVWRVATARGVLQTRRVVVATGPGTGALVPEECKRLTVLRQHVGYFAPDLPASALVPGAFPVWARIGTTANDFQYGLPEFGRPGTKLARHRTVGAADDPAGDARPDHASLQQLAGERFTLPTRLVGSETCLYTMAPGEELQVREAGPGLVVVTACSGHAFKFGPEIGRHAAAMVLQSAAT
ncbi:MAG: hypothetical protein RL148_2636 [Planctomycetota bacterium]